jgi:hypothetical protein
MVKDLHRVQRHGMQTILPSNKRQSGLASRDDIINQVNFTELEEVACNLSHIAVEWSFKAGSDDNLAKIDRKNRNQLCRRSSS